MAEQDTVRLSEDWFA